jgi:hypothetical protein
MSARATRHFCASAASGRDRCAAEQGDEFAALANLTAAYRTLRADRLARVPASQRFGLLLILERSGSRLTGASMGYEAHVPSGVRVSL